MKSSKDNIPYSLTHWSPKTDDDICAFTRVVVLTTMRKVPQVFFQPPPPPSVLFSLRCTGGHCDFWDALSHRIFLTFVWTSVFWCVHCHWLRQSIYLNSNLYFYHRYHCNNGKWIWCCTLIAILAVICVPQGSRLQHINYSHEKHKRIGTCFQGYQNY